jgi:hypothetical protein
MATRKRRRESNKQVSFLNFANGFYSTSSSYFCEIPPAQVTRPINNTSTECELADYSARPPTPNSTEVFRLWFVCVCANSINDKVIYIQTYPPVSPTLRKFELFDCSDRPSHDSEIFRVFFSLHLLLPSLAISCWYPLQTDSPMCLTVSEGNTSRSCSSTSEAASLSSCSEDASYSDIEGEPNYSNASLKKQLASWLKQKLLEKKLCSNCFSPKHQNKKCLSLSSCQICEVRHHTSLHSGPAKSGNPTTLPTTVSEVHCQTTVKFQCVWHLFICLPENSYHQSLITTAWRESQCTLWRRSSTFMDDERRSQTVRPSCKEQRIVDLIGICQSSHCAKILWHGWARCSYNWLSTDRRLSHSHQFSG